MENHSRSSLFLLELILTILLFAIAGSICIQVFAKAHQISRHAENINIAQDMASSTAELLGNSSDAAKHPWLQYFDANWQETDKSHASYQLTASFSDEAGMRQIHVIVSDCIFKEDTEELYVLEAGYHIPLTASSEGGAHNE